MRLDKPRLLDPDSAITREIAREFPATQDEFCCLAIMPNINWPYGCTRARGHDGPHVAHGGDQPVAVWPQEGK